tara:strand:- start:936 stop:1295 length:360 start_codon:yes stop_codon:yes gene_type:complete
MAEELKPCPWCRSTKIEVWEAWAHKVGDWWVACKSCAMAKGGLEGEEHAIKWWNEQVAVQFIPCPFCGCKEVKPVMDYYKADYHDDLLYRVMCQKCEGQGPPTDTAEETISRWNERVNV